MFASFEELYGGLISIEDDHICWLVGMDTVHIKMYGWDNEKVEGGEIYSSYD